MAIQVGNGIGRLSLVWWTLCGFVAAASCGVLAFQLRQETRWLAVLPVVALIVAFALHRLTCWLIEGFSGKPVALLIPRPPLYLAAGVAVVAGLLTSNWPSDATVERTGPWSKYSNDELLASMPPAGNSQPAKPFNGTLDTPQADKWWEKDSAVQPPPTAAHQEMERIHFATIEKAHPGFQSVVASKNFRDWVSIQQRRAEYERVMRSGTAPEVIGMLSAYKAMTRAQRAPAAPAPTAEEIWQRQETLRNLARSHGQVDP